MVFKSFGEGLEKRHEDKIKLARFDISRTPALARKLGVLSTPSFIIFENGKELERFSGNSFAIDNIEAFVDTVVR